MAQDRFQLRPRAGASGDTLRLQSKEDVMTAVRSRRARRILQASFGRKDKPAADYVLRFLRGRSSAPTSDVSISISITGGTLRVYLS